jgi:hypothetical protein
MSKLHKILVNKISITIIQTYQKKTSSLLIVHKFNNKFKLQTVDNKINFKILYYKKIYKKNIYYKILQMAQIKFNNLFHLLRQD